MPSITPSPRIRSVLASTLLCVAVAPAVAVKPTQSQILTLQNRYIAAYVGHDTATLNALLDDKLVFVHGNGKPASKSDTLAALSKSGASGPAALSVKSITLDNDAGVILYKDAALVEGVNTITLAGNSAAGVAATKINTEYCSYLWVRRQGHWQLALIHSTPIARVAH